MLLVGKMNKELLEARIEQFLAELENNAAEEARSPRLRTPRPAADVDRFFVLVGEAIKTEQQQEGVQKPILYTEDMPEIDDNITGEVITFSVKRRQPGSIEQKPLGHAFMERTRKQRKKLFREALQDPDHPGMKIYTYGQWYENQVEFKIWARTNKIANQRALWFEDLMENWRWYFEASGVQQVLFEYRDEDQHLAPENRKLVCRPLCYYVRTERIKVVREIVLRSLVVGSEQSN
tara:strand:+ start:47 stop:751 length:705 start_codon:yes stop_codon:yes gene_type:complete